MEERYGLILTYNHFSKVAGHTFAKDVTVSQNGIVRGTIHVTDFHLAPELTEANFSYPRGPDTSEQDITVPSSVQGGALIDKVVPRYPEDAKMKHITGSVILDAQIDDTGKVAQLDVISAPSASLVKAAEYAVRAWKYKPYLVDGKPVSLRTTITVNFFMTP